MSDIPSYHEGKQKPTTVTWGETTDPNEHDQSNFRYLVHLVTGGAGPSFSVDTASIALEALGLDFTKKSPDRLNSLPRISSSIIDPSHTVTFVVGRWGYIIEASDEDVLATSPHDIGSDAFKLSEPELVSKYPKLDAQELLTKTEEYRHNEVLLRGGNVVTKAIFYLASEFPDLEPSHIDQEMHEIKQLATDMSLPVIAI